MYLQPDLNRQRIHKAEQSGWLPTWNLEQDGDTQVHKGLKFKNKYLSHHIIDSFSQILK